MDFKESIRASLSTADFFMQAYLGDLTSKELLARAVPGANHIAWQLGHLIGAERALAAAAWPDLTLALPAGFAEQHGKDAAASDDPAKFLSKEQYFALAKEVRAETLRVLDQLSPADLSLPVSGRVPPFVKRRGDALVTIPGHWILHAGQWAVLRRKLERPRQF